MAAIFGGTKIFLKTGSASQKRYPVGQKFLQNCSILHGFRDTRIFVFCIFEKIASLGRQEPQPAGTAKWQTTLRFGKILGTTSVVRSTENPQDVVSHSWFPFSFPI